MAKTLFVPDEVKRSIGNHLRPAIARAVDGYDSASEDEDTMTGHLGACLKIENQTVHIPQGEIPGDWTWAIDYHKFRGRGAGATENILGADGIFELKVTVGSSVDKKALLFQSKMNWDSDASLLRQSIKMSNWREAAFVLNYTSRGFEAYAIDAVIKARGIKTSDVRGTPLAEYLHRDFLDCLVGDTELRYASRSRMLRWRAANGLVVSTNFAPKNQIVIDVEAPLHGGKKISPSEIYDYRMQATESEILMLRGEPSAKELKAAHKSLSLTYHPDKFSNIDAELNKILTKRMQEINSAYQARNRSKK